MIIKKSVIRYSDELALKSGDSFFRRHLALRLVNDMTDDELLKIFKFDKVSWNDELSPDNPDWLNEKIAELFYPPCHEMEISIVL